MPNFEFLTGFEPSAQLFYSYHQKVQSAKILDRVKFRIICHNFLFGTGSDFAQNQARKSKLNLKKYRKLNTKKVCKYCY